MSYMRRVTQALLRQGHAPISKLCMDKVRLCAIADAKSRIVSIVRDGNFDWSGGVGNSEDLLAARSELIRLEEGK